MEINGIIQLLVAVGIRQNLQPSDLKAAIKVEWMRQKRAARTPEQRKASAAKAKATREERKKYRPVVLPAAYNTFETERAANAAALREALGEEGWAKYLHEKEVAEFGGEHYGHREILNFAVGRDRAHAAIKAAGLEDAFF